MKTVNFLEQSKCEGCGVYPGSTHKDDCSWLKGRVKERQEKQKIRDMIEKFIDVEGLVDKIYEMSALLRT